MIKKNYMLFTFCSIVYLPYIAMKYQEVEASLFVKFFSQQFDSEIVLICVEIFNVLLRFGGIQ